MKHPITWRTIGHVSAKRLLEKEVQRDAFAHAYVFWGPEGVGKRSLAEEFGAALTGGSPGTVVRFDCTSSNITGLRMLLGQLALKPTQGAGKQIAILDGAEALSSAMSNALLKTLEEPSEATILCLIASRRNLPATLLSRCRTVGFGPLSDEELQSIGQQHAAQVPADCLALAYGSAARLLGLLSSEDALVRARQLAADWQRLTKVALQEKLATIAVWAQEDGEQVQERLVQWMHTARRAAESAPVTLKRLQVLHEAWQRLRQNANKKLVFEYICLNI